MSTTAKELYSQFEFKIAHLNNYRIKHEDLLLSGHLDCEEVEQMYAGLFLSLFAEFESLIEDLFFGLLKNEIISSHPSYKKLVVVEPTELIENVVLGDRFKYLDWLPLQSRTHPRAKIYFYDGIPFTLVSDGSSNSKNLNLFQAVRNAIAHKSSYSLQRFHRAIETLTLLPGEKVPAAFLRSIPNRRLNKTQYEIANDELKVIAKTICQ